jgi:hypothetical protein
MKVRRKHMLLICKFLVMSLNKLDFRIDYNMDFDQRVRGGLSLYLFKEVGTDTKFKVYLGMKAIMVKIAKTIVVSNI